MVSSLKVKFSLSQFSFPRSLNSDDYLEGEIKVSLELQNTRQQILLLRP